MRRALAAAAVLGAVTVGPVATQTAWADTVPAPARHIGVVQAIDEEPASSDGQDDRAKYGLIGLLGMLGLFGYQKVKDTRKVRARSTGTGTAERSAPAAPAAPAAPPARGAVIGDVDDDGSGSRRI